MLEVKIKRKLPGFSLDVDFNVDREILTILGPSGSGKTMTLQCIAGLIQPDEGYIKVNNRVLLDSVNGLNLPPQSRKVGFVFQDYALFRHLTVKQNISYGLQHLSSTEAKKKVSELLDLMNIAELADRYPRQLSAGQQQRVAVARALAPEPEVLLLDEPFSSLDSMVREHLQQELQALQRFYKGNMLFVTHDLNEGYRLGSRMAVFESGRVAQCDDKARLISSPANVTVARLTGFKNLFDGIISEIFGGNIFIETPGLGKLRALLHEHSCLDQGMQVTIGIRPENIGIKEQPGDNTVLANVDDYSHEITGSRILFTVSNADGIRLEAFLPGTQKPDSFLPEKETFVFLPPEHMVIISAKE